MVGEANYEQSVKACGGEDAVISILHDLEQQKLTPEEEWRRSQLLAGLNTSPVSPVEDRGGRQSSFGEVFEEVEEEGGVGEGSATAQERGGRKRNKNKKADRVLGKGDKVDRVLGRE